ncbi:hypothetical protein B0H14DRAFT_2608235 [Mycena olivaceomarginata]|nr:hypothetical protein B0H14DRAFT_2608235 [Mycena olivaceomarginata]
MFGFKLKPGPCTGIQVLPIPKPTISGPSHHSHPFQARPAPKLVPFPDQESLSAHLCGLIEQLAGHVPEAMRNIHLPSSRNYKGSIAKDAEPWEVWDRQIGNRLLLS